ncbi:MAG: hypothetical protein H6541_06545 [Lentimicrobiaceae bacterium]|nr:hypothetical protein [Lentimicrobiaceae bacterium]MCB9023238.1 hypothetical protein [Lentimicrobiaceae bacterium]MCO5266486.1 hypothetical protein [Lentimicrobium sp.]
MKKFMTYALIASIAILSSCKKDEESFKVPSATAPAATTVQTDAVVELTFNYLAEAGFKSSAVTATNGTASIKTDGTANATSGTVVVNYIAGSAAGAGSVVLTVTDSKDQTSTATAVISVVEEQLVFNVTGNITSNTTWESGKVYVLESRIAVVSGVTLTIEPGVIVKGQAGTGANATALLIARGGKLIADGTANAPIIFTSVADEIMPGEIASPNLDAELNGLWGGLIILGNAPISADAASVQIEGIPPSDQNGLYGGTDATDNSGIIRYVSIRHGGANIGEGNEINGLTLGGVGSGTIIENIEIVANQDDGIEWFGGTVNVKNAIIWNAGDDAVDTDQSWGGTLDNFIVVNPGDECFELDGPEGTMVAKHTIMNGTVYAANADGLVDNDPNSNVDMSNVYFRNIKAGQDFDQMPTDYICVFQNLQVTLPEGTVVTDFFKDGSDAFVTVVPMGANTVGADITKFQTWSWAVVSGALNGF